MYTAPDVENVVHSDWLSNHEVILLTYFALMLMPVFQQQVAGLLACGTHSWYCLSRLFHSSHIL